MAGRHKIALINCLILNITPATSDVLPIAGAVSHQGEEISLDFLTVSDEQVGKICWSELAVGRSVGGWVKRWVGRWVVKRSVGWTIGGEWCGGSVGWTVGW